MEQNFFVNRMQIEHEAYLPRQSQIKHKFIYVRWRRNAAFCNLEFSTSFDEVLKFELKYYIVLS